ncbi:reverse transcriptase domain-containing protein [Tanacetum coccineum]
MEPRPEPNREATPPLRLRSHMVCRQRERIVGFEEALNREGSRGGRNTEGSRPSEIETRENGNMGVNIPPLLAAHLGRNESGQPLQSSLTSVHGGYQPSTNIGGITLLTQKKFTKMHLAVHNIKKKEGESRRAFVTRYADDTLQILGLHEEQCISGFVYGLRTQSLVEHLSTDLSSTYKGLMEKTYTWIEAREVATNGAPNDRRENSERSRKSSWDNNRGQKGRDRFSPYRAPNHGLLSSLSKIPREILATDKAARSFEQPPHHGHDTNDYRQLRNHIEEAVKSRQLSHLVKGIKKEREESYTKNNEFKGFTFEGKEITFPSRGSNSSAPVIIKAKIFGREVSRVHMDSGSSCKVIYEHCFMKLRPSIRASKIDSKVPLIEFLGEKSRSSGEIPLEITIGDAPLARKETLKFVIVKSNSPYNMLLGRTIM